MIIDRKKYSAMNRMTVYTLRMGREKFGELIDIVTGNVPVIDCTSVDSLISEISLDPEMVMAVMFDAVLINEPGFSLFRRLEEDGRFAPISVVACSDGKDPTLCEKCIAAGVNEFIEPPYNKPSLYLRLKNAARAKDSVTFNEMALMLKELPANIYLKDANGKYIFSAHYWHHLRGHEPGWTIRGKSEFDIQKDPAIAEKAYNADKKMIAERKGTSYILDLNTDGIQEYIQVTKSPTYDSMGNVSGIIAIMTDVTELEMLKRRLEDKTEQYSAELKVAEQIQYSMLPMDFEGHKDVDIAASMTPAKTVGGDFYDFFFMDDIHLCMVMADVSGKGVPAALGMTITKIVLHDRALVGGTPAQILRDSNVRICANNKMRLFITVWFGILDIRTGIITYANAGHEYPAVKHASGQYELLVKDNMPPLGTVDDIVYEDNVIKMCEGGSIFLYTDGVTDIKNDDGQRFGTDRMLKTLNCSGADKPDDVIAVMKSELESFRGSCDPFDDITMMNIEYKGTH